MSVDAERDGPVARVRLNRPEKLNAITTAMAERLDALVEELNGDDDVRVVVIAGTGKAFSVGSDIDELSHVDSFVDYHRRSEYVASVRRLEKPVIAMIDGYAMGGGLELAMSCDVRVASERARFAASEIDLGWIGRAGNTQLLPRLVGYGAAARMLFTGEPIDAAEALRLGLVEEVVPHDALEDGVADLAATIGAKSPLALRMAKRALRMSLEAPLQTGLAYEWELATLCFASEDKDEGIRAFKEKRTPRFRGR